MISASGSYDVVILGSGIAGLAGALAARSLGLQPVVLEKAARLGGGTVHSYGLIWVGQNHLGQAAGHSDSRNEVFDYMRFLGGGNVDESRLSAFVEHAPEAWKQRRDVVALVENGDQDCEVDVASGHALRRTAVT